LFEEERVVEEGEGVEDVEVELGGRMLVGKCKVEGGKVGWRGKGLLFWLRLERPS